MFYLNLAALITQKHYFPGKHLSRCLTLSSTLLPVAGNVAHLNPPPNCAQGLAMTPGPVSVSQFMLIYLLLRVICLFVHPVHRLSNPLLPNSLPLSVSSHVFLCSWLKMVRHGRKGRSCYGNEAGNKSWTRGYRGRGTGEKKREMCLNKHAHAERRRGQEREKVREVWINKNICRGGIARSWNDGSICNNK